MPVWPEIVFSPEWMSRLERMAARRFVDEVTAEESVTFVIEKLSDDDWARCQQFAGNSKPETWLFSVSSNLLEEFSRRRYGRARPPEWLRQEGDLWVQIWRWLCLERLFPESICDRLCDDGTREAPLIRNIMRAIKARLPWCGVSTLPIPVEYQADDGSTLNLADTVAPVPAPLESMEKDAKEELLASLSALAQMSTPDALHDPALLTLLKKKLALETDELLLLKLHFQEGLSGLAIARLLGVPNHQPGRQIRKLLAKIRTVFEQEGIDFEPAEASGGDTQ